MQNAPVHRPFYVKPKYDRLSISMKTDFRLPLFALLPAVVLSGCKTSGVSETHYVKLDYASIRSGPPETGRWSSR